MKLRASSRWLSSLSALLAVVFIAAQATALSHELEHVLGKHDAPCALHVAADHLVMAAAPDPVPAVALAAEAGHVAPPRQVLLPPPGNCERRARSTPPALKLDRFDAASPRL